MSNEEGQTLLAGLFGSSIKADGHELLSQIVSQMLVSSLERHDGELVEKFQSLFATSNQHSLLQILHVALYRLSNNLLSEGATDELLAWLIEQEQNELLVSFLQSRMPSVHACATKILESALRIGDADFLEHLITAGIDLSPLKGARGGRNLVHAASESNIQIVQILLNNGADVDILTSEGYPYTALHYAVFEDQLEMIQVLLKAGANIEAVTADSKCNTALSLALHAKNIELVHILVTAGANLDICKVGGLPAIIYSAFFCDDESHQILLSGSEEDRISMTAHGAWQAATGGIQALSKYLAERDEDLRYPPMEVLNYALQHAIKNEDNQAILSLLDKGADPNAEIIIKCRVSTPLLTAVAFCDIDIVKILLQAGGDVKNPWILSAAIRSQKPIEMLRFMLDMGANIETSGGIAIRSAVWSKNLEAVQLLLYNGANVNDPAYQPFTALQSAIFRQNIELVKILLNAGSDVNASSCQERNEAREQTALQLALERIGRSDLRLEIVQILLAAGADVNGPKNGRIGASILESAICTGDEELVEILLKEGADVNSLPQGKEGRSPIQAAAERGSIPLVRLLLKSGADANASAGCDNGRTAIQAASSATNHTMELIDLLIDSGADIHAPAGLNGGATALQGAAIRGHIKIALKFLEAGADVNAAGAISNGRTALDGAAEHGRLDMVQMLLNAGARGDSTKAHRFGRAMN